MKPRVSVVIPTRDEEKTIGKCLHSLMALTYPREKIEIIIINDGSRDNTREILNSFEIKILETNGEGPSKGRNIGIQEASGDFIAFTDADCIVEKAWIDQLLKCFNSEDIMGVGGAQKSPFDETPFGRQVQDFLTSLGIITEYAKIRTKIVQVNHNPTCNVMYRKEVFRKVGLFDEGLWPGEDVDLDYRINQKGYKLLYTPHAIVYHYRPETVQKFAHMMCRYGSAQANLVKKYGVFRPIHCVPGFVALGFISWPPILFYNPSMGIFLTVFALLLPLTLFFIQNKSSIMNILTKYRLFFLTLIHWNIGFLKSILFSEKKHNSE